MLLPHNTMVLVVDGSRARLFRNAGREADLELEELGAPDIAVSSESGGHHHSSSANPDRHTEHEDAFASAVAHWLRSETLAGRIEGVFVIAPPRLLGELRHHYTPDLKSKIVSELAKDLVGHSLGDVTAAVRDHR